MGPLERRPPKRAVAAAAGEVAVELGLLELVVPASVRAAIHRRHTKTVLNTKHSGDLKDSTSAHIAGINAELEPRKQQHHMCSLWGVFVGAGAVC
jgi:hypothetical protein